MRLFFIFLFFYSALFQAQAQVLIEYPINQNMDQFDWQAFIDEENVRKHIDFRRQTLEYVGPARIITGLNLDKLDLIRLEIELDLYKQGRKRGLSGYKIEQAEEAIRLHWENVGNIENQIRAYAGLGVVRAGDIGTITESLQRGVIDATEDYRLGAWELYKGDRDVVFNMVEKMDKGLYEDLDGNDEVYAGFIAPYVERYTAKMGGLAQEYYNSLGLAYEGKAELDGVNVMRLIEMYSDSLEIHNCFKENFKFWTGGAEQRALEGAIKGWHTQQGLLGMNSFVETYKNYKEEYGTSFKIDSVAANLFKFTEAPEEVRE
ncbi:MAG: hypothetical protein OXJ52_08895, partial [Oligoflexia bacterium]|nr:hypothetical protein [Oligoflexia bacterium]